MLPGFINENAGSKEFGHQKKSPFVNAGGMTVRTASGNMIKGDMINVTAVWLSGKSDLAAGVSGVGYLIRVSQNREMFFVERGAGF